MKDNWIVTKLWLKGVLVMDREKEREEKLLFYRAIQGRTSLTKSLHFSPMKSYTEGTNDKQTERHSDL